MSKFKFRVSRLKFRVRRGSVLIIVIGLLVLMAIIGTAYISTARVDRTAAASNTENVQIDLLLKGVEDMATAQIIADINPYVAANNATKFRTGTTYTPYNSPLNDAWLADRVPVELDSTVYANMASNAPVWRFLSAPLTSTGVFTDPTSGGTYGGTGTGPGTSGSSATRGDYQPTFTTVGGVVYPALEYWESDKNIWSAPFVAADTDGDGVADAGLTRLPCGEINGITYYGAYRIVDNNAAINASIAWAPQAISPAAPAPTPITPAYLAAQQPLPGNYFPVNVDLADLLSTGDSLTSNPSVAVPGYPAFSTSFNGWRYGAATPSTTPTHGTGYSYDTGYDAAWHELGMRLQNPGSTTFQSLAMADSAAMAHRFVIRDPNASPSILEQALPVSTVSNAATQAYSAIIPWFNSNFNYWWAGNAPTPANFSLRSVLVGQNGVSNFVPNKYGPTGGTPGAAWAAGTNYTFGDWVSYNNHAYVCILPNAGQTPPTTVATGSNYYADSAYWVYEPWYNAPVKTSVNTATFGQLWLAYWEVMCDATYGQNAAPNTTVALSEQQVGTNMFRSSLRYSTGTPSAAVGAPLSATQELQLRASLAAVNTIALRNTIPTYLSTQGITIYNYASGAPAAQYTAKIMGNAPQPYITEVYADNDPGVGDSTSGYIAIELYNPYPYNIQLTGWALATVARTGTPGAALTPTVIPTTSTTWNTNGPVIPANGYAVIANTASPANYGTAPTATVANDASPSAAAPPLYVVSDLDQAFGNDLVLMRPPPQTASAAGAPTNIAGYFPADSYDFTGLAAQTAGTVVAARTFEWHYTRPQTLPWQFVYPGPFNPALGVAPTYSPRFTATTPLLVATPGVPTVPLTSLGKQDATGSYTGMTIQIDNVDFGGPVKLAASSNNFPFGQFPRNADIMQVPFIGSYCIYDASNNLIEMNPITLDSAYAAWTASDQTAVPVVTQNIGRFAPWYGVDYLYGNQTGTGTVYGWATRLMDYLSVQAPSDDYAPNTDPVQYFSVTGSTPVGVANAKSTVVNAVTGNIGSLTEDTVPTQGLININTAPWRVLATLPFSDDPNTNAALAQAIVDWRDGYWSTQASPQVNVAPHGPFQNLFALNAVSAVYNAQQISLPGATSPIPAPINFMNTLGSYYTGSAPNLIYANAYTPSAPTHAPTNNDGMLTPLYKTFTANYPSATPYVPTTDFQTLNLALARVSNLITTRSDSYTVYVEVQGWQNAGTATAKLVVQRRAAFIVDRSGMTPSNPTPTITNISTN